MKIILPIFLLLSFLPVQAEASEIFGLIRTNPAAPTVNPPAADSEQTGQPIPPVPSGQNQTGATALWPSANLTTYEKNQILKNTEKTDTGVKVLGAYYYPDGSLVRGPDKKIFVIFGRYKTLIHNLIALQKYHGQEIISISAEEISDFIHRQCRPGDLIREKGGVKIFFVQKNGKEYVPNLTILRQHYSGQKIHNLDKDEIGKY